MNSTPRPTPPVTERFILTASNMLAGIPLWTPPVALAAGTLPSLELTVECILFILFGRALSDMHGRPLFAAATLALRMVGYALFTLSVVVSIVLLFAGFSIIYDMDPLAGQLYAAAMLLVIVLIIDNRRPKLPARPAMQTVLTYFFWGVAILLPFPLPFRAVLAVCALWYGRRRLS